MGFNFSIIDREAKRLLTDILESSAGSDIEYKKYEGETFDPSTGKNVPTYSVYSVRVIRTNTALESQGASTVIAAIGFEVGEQFFIAKYSDLPRDPYNKNIMKDIIVDNGSEKQIKRAIPVFKTLVKLRV